MVIRRRPGLKKAAGGTGALPGNLGGVGRSLRAPNPLGPGPLALSWVGEGPKSQPLTDLVVKLPTSSAISLPPSLGGP